MMNKNVYEQLEAKYKDVASWAIWAEVVDTVKSGTGDMSVFQDPNILEKLHGNFVIIAMNASEHAERKDQYEGSWRMFHSDDNRRQQDFKMRYAFKDTVLWGSYMTDLIKNHPDKNSDQVIEHIKQNPHVLEENIGFLKDELNILGGNPVLIALGNNVDEWLRKGLDDSYTIVKLPHYSAQQINKENYRKATIKLLESLRA